MSHIRLQCPHCNQSHLANLERLKCKNCSAPLEVFYANPLSSLSLSTGWETFIHPSPIHDEKSMVTMGEGNTPYVKLNFIGRNLRIDNLYAKLEFLNPSGSFKDRGSAVMVSVAKEYGIKEIVEDSSGNAGASMASYTARAGIKSHIFVPMNTPSSKIQQIEIYGAKTHLIKGTREETAHAAMNFASMQSLVYASHALSPYFLEGTKTFAYEIARQFGENKPAHIVFPVGNGTLYIGSFRGFKELRDINIIDKIPKLHCIQSNAVKPISAALAGKKWSSHQPAQATAAAGIAVAAPPRLDRILSILNSTGGNIANVSENQILYWQHLLAEKEGLFVEPTSAAAFAGLEILNEQGIFKPNETVLLPVTGFGLKDPPH